MAHVNVAINGFGRIGRLVLRALVESGRDDIRVVSINDLGPVETNAHLLRWDSNHGRLASNVVVDGDTIDVGQGQIKVTAERDPAQLPHGPPGGEVSDGLRRNSSSTESLISTQMAQWGS